MMSPEFVTTCAGEYSDFCDVDSAVAWLAERSYFNEEYLAGQAGWTMSNHDKSTFWYLQMVNKLGGGFDYADMEKNNTMIYKAIPTPEGGTMRIEYTHQVTSWVGTKKGTKEPQAVIFWAPHVKWDLHTVNPSAPTEAPRWFTLNGGDSIGTLAHELRHVQLSLSKLRPGAERWAEVEAIKKQNDIMGARYDLMPDFFDLPKESYMRPIDGSSG